MVRIGIITGSTRDSRVNTQVAEWVKSTVEKLLDEVMEWSTALKTIRVKEEATV